MIIDISDWFTPGIGLIGAVIGGCLSYIGSKKATEDSIKAQTKIYEHTRELEERRAYENRRTAAKIIYIDFLNAICEGFNVVKEQKRQYVGTLPNLLPMNTGYSAVIVSLSGDLNSNDLVLINKLYGIMEKIRYDIMQFNYLLDTTEHIRLGYSILLVEVFGDKYLDMMQYSLNLITKDFIVEQLDSKYKALFERLRSIGELDTYGN